MSDKIVPIIHEDRTYEITVGRNADNQRTVKMRAKRNSGTTDRDFSQLAEMEVDGNFFELEPTRPPDWICAFDDTTSELVLYEADGVTEVFRWPITDRAGNPVRNLSDKFVMKPPREL